MSRRIAALAGSALFLVIAPGTVAGLVPWWLTRWTMHAPFFPGARVLGVALIAGGLPVLLDSFRRFAVEGLGTPAPVAPPQHLVISGLYRYVRNPMYVAVASLIFGQALLFGSVRLAEYGAIVVLVFHLFVVLVEEPSLRRKFGGEYEAYCARVYRWIPTIPPPMNADQR